MTVLYLSKIPRFVPLETMLIYSLTFETRLTITIDYSALTLSLSYFETTKLFSPSNAASEGHYQRSRFFLELYKLDNVK